MKLKFETMKTNLKNWVNNLNRKQLNVFTFTLIYLFTTLLLILFEGSMEVFEGGSTMSIYGFIVLPLFFATTSAFLMNQMQFMQEKVELFYEEYNKINDTVENVKSYDELMNIEKCDLPKLKKMIVANTTKMYYINLVTKINVSKKFLK
jgi:activator of 2-hydroxyglutaryl-CoA dehydratase